MKDGFVGRVLGIALRSSENGPMHVVEAAKAVEGAGLDGDLPGDPERGVTFIASGHWREVTSELAADLPWHTRRANVLIESDGLGDLIGRTVRVGDVEVRINAETRPCGLMDKLHNGLKNALKPNCRAGIYGRVLKEGQFRVGDQMTVCDQ